METGKDTNVEHLSSVPPQEFNDSFDKIEHVSTNEDIDSRALGGDSVADLPKHYYWSWSFIATLAVCGSPDAENSSMLTLMRLSRE